MSKSENSAALGAMLREKREREGLSLREAGAASGIAFSTFGRIESGANPSLKVDRLARAWLNGEAPLLPPPPMTLRDWFAGQALAGLMANPGGPLQANDACGWAYANCGIQDVAREAYCLADAMLAEREKGGAA